MSERLDQIERILAQTAEQQQANAEAIARLEAKTDLIISEAQQIFNTDRRRIADLETETLTLTQNVRALTTNVNTLTENMKALTHSDRVLDFEVGEVVGNVKTLRTSIEDLTRNVEALTGNLNTLTRNVEALTRNAEISNREIQRIWEYLMRQYPNGSGSSGAP